MRRLHRHISRFLTISNPQPDSSQKVVAGQGLSVPHGKLQTDVGQLFHGDVVVDERMVVVGI